VRVVPGAIALLAGVVPVVVTGPARAGVQRSTAVRDPAAAIRQINEERVENGIPGGIAVDHAWSRRCLQHARWMRRNRAVEHVEAPGSPLYTIAGAWAGMRSVLSGGYPWTTRANPWETAPLHLAQLLAPRLRRMGVGIYRGYACATTFAGYGRPRTGRDVVYAYPSGSTRVAWREHANEWPFTPQRFVGIPERKATGPYLYVFADGPWIRARDAPTIRAATLTGPHGRVEVRFLDSSNRDVGPYLPEGSGLLIPVRPLERRAVYTARVTLAAGRRRVIHTWTFVTRG
jgi:cysteine-rich secretory family protein